jgi:hypothetical protein
MRTSCRGLFRYRNRPLSLTPIPQGALRSAPARLDTTRYGREGALYMICRAITTLFSATGSFVQWVPLALPVLNENC